MPADLQSTSTSAGEGNYHLEVKINLMSADSEKTNDSQAIGAVSRYPAFLEDIRSCATSLSSTRDRTITMGTSPQRERITKEVNELKVQQQRVQLCQDEAEGVLAMLDAKLTNFKLLHRESCRSQSISTSSGGSSQSTMAGFYSREGSEELAIAEIDEKTLSLRRQTDSDLSLDNTSFSNTSFSEDALVMSKSDSLKHRRRDWVKSMGGQLDSEDEGICEEAHREVFSEDDVLDEPCRLPLSSYKRSSASSADIASPDSSDSKEKTKFVRWLNSQDGTWC